MMVTYDKKLMSFTLSYSFNYVDTEIDIIK